MDALGSGGGRARELAVLALGLGSAAALSWAAFGLHSGSSVAGQIALERRAGEVSDAVLSEWERLLRDPEPLAGEESGLFRWRAGESFRRDAGRDAFGEPDPAPSVLETLLSEAERLELQEGRPDAALSEVLTAIEKDPGAGRLLEARLRAIQLGARLGRAHVVAEQWQRMRAEIDWSVARSDTSYLLIAALAAAPLWDPVERAVVQRELARAWASGDLALPPEPPTLVRVAGEDGAERRLERVARVQLLRERARSMGAQDSAEGDSAEIWAQVLERERMEALEQALGGLPDPSDDGRWHPLPAVGDVFLARRASAGEVRGIFVTPLGLGRALERRMNLPAGFAIDLEGGATASGPIVRERTELPGTDLGLRLRHADPARIVRAARERAGTLRAALLVLAALTAAASLVTFRGLRRERRLAELKSGFVAGVSHDLRTPLASILLMAENLEQGRVPGDAARARYYSSIRREADRLRRLVDDVLDFSRIERGEGAELALEELELARFFDALFAETAERVERAGGRLQVRRGELPASAALDADALRRAVWNLVDNALEHSGSREVGLSVRAEGRALVIAVSDRGRGIPPARREEVFRPFARLTQRDGESDAASRSGGTGLGLAIVRALARAHGGEATVRAGEGGVGAVFEVRLVLGASSGAPDPA